MYWVISMQLDEFRFVIKLIIAKKLVSHVKDPSSNIEKVLDIGFVGEPIKVNPSVIHTLSNAGFIPVISPIGVGLKGETFNINADIKAQSTLSLGYCMNV